VARKDRDKEENDIETLTHLVKNLTTEVSELKQWKMDMFARNHLPRQRQGSMSSCNNHYPANCAQISMFHLD